jgi:putative sigma-54 modulation protein
VTVDLSDRQKLVEFVVQAEHKHDIVGRQSIENGDIPAAVDLVMAKLEGQLRRYKEKIQQHRRTPSAGDVSGAPAVEESGEE